MKKIVILGLILLAFNASSQTFTDVYTLGTVPEKFVGLNIGGGKDGGHTWGDYDLDGDMDLLLNTNSTSYLLRNNDIGAGTGFTDVTALLTDGMSNGRERSACWADVNGDGYLDFLINDNSRVELRIQHVADGIFGDGLGGTVPFTFDDGPTTATNTHVDDGFNSEGLGILDYDQDGDLDFYIDNHNFRK